MKTRRLLSVIISLCIALGSVFTTGISAFADEPVCLMSADGNWEFYANDNKMAATLSRCYMTGSYENFKIPERIRGVNNKEYIVDVLGASVVGGGILNENISVENLFIPKSVTKIESEEFGFNKTIKTVTIEDGTLPLEIGSCAFYYCPLLKTVNFGNRTTHIYYNAFTDCESIKTVVLPKNVELVEFGAFDATKAYVYNSKCVLDEHCFDEGTVIYGIENSTAQKHAESYNCKFKKLVDCKLVKTEYVYNNKVKTPKVILKDYKGKNLSKDEYSVSYQKGRNNVGKYRVTVTLGGVYSGKITKFFTINPKNTQVKSVTPIKQGFIINWNKQSTQTSGYQVQVSTSKKFNKNLKTINVNNKNSTSKTIKKLTANKKYYVRVCTFKKVGNKKYYSNWSNIKAITIKNN